MKVYDVKVDTSALERAEYQLRNVPGGVETAIRSALLRAREHFWTQSSREVQKKYDISPKTLRENKGAKMTYHYYPGRGIEIYINFLGSRISLHEFNGSAPKDRVDQANALTVRTAKTYPPTMKSPGTKNGMTPVHPSIPARAHQYQGSPVSVFKNAFVAQMRNGHKGIFEREKGKTRRDSNLPIRQVEGDSFPRMLENEEVREELTRDAAATIEKRLDQEVDRILKGYGFKQG